MFNGIYEKVISVFLALLLIFSFTLPVFASDEDFDLNTGTYTIPEGTEEMKKNTISLKDHSLSEIKRIVLPESMETVKKEALNLDELTSLNEIVIRKVKGGVVFEEGAIPENDSRVEGIVISYKTEELIKNPRLKPEKKKEELENKKKKPEDLPGDFTGEIKPVKKNSEKTFMDKEKEEFYKDIKVSEGTKKGSAISLVVTLAVIVSILIIGIIKFRPAPSY